MISNASPTAARTAASRATSSAMRLADLDLRAAKALRLGADRVVDQLLASSMVQPAAFGRVERAPSVARRRPACHSGSPASAAAQVPQRRVDRREREARDGADRRGVGGEEEVVPDRFDLVGVAADQPRREMVAQQRDRPTSRRCRSCSV